MTTALIIIAVFAIYWTPTAVAAVREHPSTAAIGVLNFCLGWTFLGWVIALVWACMAIQRLTAITVQTGTGARFVPGERITTLGPLDGAPHWPCKRQCKS